MSSSNPIRNLFNRQQPRASAAQLAAMTSGFYACDQEMGLVASAMDAARAVSIGPVPTAEWDHLRGYFETVLARYLRLIDSESAGASPAEVTQCTGELGQVTAALQHFASAHRQVLDNGRAAHSAAQRATHDVDDAAGRVATVLEQAPTQVLALSSIQAATDELSRRVTAFQSASGLAARLSAAQAAISAGRRVEQLVANAPNLAADAERTLRSLTTRKQAVEHRLSLLPETMSELLRDYSSACSDDLRHTSAAVSKQLDNATVALDHMGTLQVRAPDEALVRAEDVRAYLGEADQALDQAFDRLIDLRSVRRDPQEVAGGVRFRLRDAQQFAINHGLVADWGSVLDAQLERLGRASEVLAKIHPDYWSYLTQVRAVDARIVEIVERMRAQIASR